MLSKAIGRYSRIERFFIRISLRIILLLPNSLPKKPRKED
jgi:hypothetical protein